MSSTPISGTRALILAQCGNKPHSDEINSTRGLNSTLEIIENKFGGGGHLSWQTFGTHIGAQKSTTHLPALHHFCVCVCVVCCQTPIGQNSNFAPWPLPCSFNCQWQMCHCLSMTDVSSSRKRLRSKPAVSDRKWWDVQSVFRWATCLLLWDCFNTAFVHTNYFLILSTRLHHQI